MGQKDLIHLKIQDQILSRCCALLASLWRKQDYSSVCSDLSPWLGRHYLELWWRNTKLYLSSKLSVRKSLSEIRWKKLYSFPSDVIWMKHRPHLSVWIEPSQWAKCLELSRNRHPWDHGLYIPNMPNIWTFTSVFPTLKFTKLPPEKNILTKSIHQG